MAALGVKKRGGAEAARAAALDQKNRRDLDEKQRRDEEAFVAAAVSAVVGEGTTVGKSVGTLPAAVSALVVESFGTDATCATATQDTCGSPAAGRREEFECKLVEVSMEGGVVGELLRTGELRSDARDPLPGP